MHPQLFIPEPLELVYGASPAAGASFSLTSPGQQGWQLVTVSFRLVTSATVATRYVTVDYDDGNGSLFVSNGFAGGITASTTAFCSFNADRGSSEGNAGNQLFAPLFRVQMQAGQKVQINVLNIDATDQLSRIVLGFIRTLESAS